jgi:hypothetical protein
VPWIFKAKRAWRIVLAAVFVIVFSLWYTGYHTWEFKGGERIRDSGFFSYPRYHAELGRFNLWEAGKHQFTARGLPRDSLTLSLQVLEASADDRKELTSLGTFLSATVADDSGNILCTASGRLSDGGTRGVSSWVLSSNGSDSSFWHPGCREFPISRSKAYTVTVAVSGVDPRSPHRTIMVILQGGGTELP